MNLIRPQLTLQPATPCRVAGALCLSLALIACGPTSDPSTPSVGQPSTPAPRVEDSQSPRRHSPPKSLLAPPVPGQLPPQFTQGISYQHSPFSSRPRRRDGSVEPRAAQPLTTAQRLALKQAMDQAKDGPLAKDNAISLIDSFSGTPSLELIPLINALLQHSDRDVRGQALTLIEGLSDPSLLPLIQQGLRDTDPAVRLQAIETTAQLQSPALASLLTASYNDSDPNVRLLAFQTATTQPPEQRQQLITAAVSAPHSDLAQSAIDLLEAEPSKFSISTIMDGLDHPDAFIKERAHDILALTLGTAFQTKAEAKAWWAANEQKYNQDLVRIRD